MEALQGVLVQGFILSIMTLGVYISFKILDFPDMSVDGSFSLGGAIIVVALKFGISPILASLLALISGILAGLLTGILHVKFKISNLLSGILVMGILYSLNLRIMGKANIPIFNSKNIFNDYNPLVIAIVFLLVFKIIIDLFLKTGLGYALKGVGDNPQMIKSLGVDIGKIKILGLMISNGLVAFSGSIMAQYQGFADISMGIGTLILGIASIIVGTSIIKGIKKINSTSSVIIGTLIYQITIYFAMNMGLTPVDLKMVTSFVIIIFLVVGTMKNSESRKIGGVTINVKNAKLIKKLS
ncbi:MAG: transporter, permease protein [Clostridiaceae bacterium]|jgi:putative ABC transport system permease protein|nr:transporter, permease protein [Clostridiaceae bacterium]